MARAGCPEVVVDSPCGDDGRRGVAHARRGGGECGVSTPSLYKHVASLGDLRVLIGVRIMREMTPVHRGGGGPRRRRGGHGVMHAYREYGGPSARSGDAADPLHDPTGRGRHPDAHVLDDAAGVRLGGGLVHACAGCGRSRTGSCPSRCRGFAAGEARRDLRPTRRHGDTSLRRTDVTTQARRAVLALADPVRLYRRPAVEGRDQVDGAGGDVRRRLGRGARLRDARLRPAGARALRAGRSWRRRARRQWVGGPQLRTRRRGLGLHGSRPREGPLWTSRGRRHDGYNRWPYDVRRGAARDRRGAVLARGSGAPAPPRWSAVLLGAAFASSSRSSSRAGSGIATACWWGRVRWLPCPLAGRLRVLTATDPLCFAELPHGTHGGNPWRPLDIDRPPPGVRLSARRQGQLPADGGAPGTQGQPNAATAPRQNRAFMQRTVRFPGGRGRRAPFLDIARLHSRTSQVAQAIDPTTRVAYVDSDHRPDHARALLTAARRAAPLRRRQPAPARGDLADRCANARPGQAVGCCLRVCTFRGNDESYAS